MNDFLNQFEKDSYRNATPSQDEMSTGLMLSEMSTKRQMAAINGPSHELVAARSRRGAKVLIIVLILVGVVAACLALYFSFRVMNQISVKQLVGVSLGDAKSWALKNRIEFNITEEFSLEHDKDTVFAQSPEDGKKIQKGSTVDITVSKGPDPDEIIKLPNFKDMDSDAIRDWADTNKLKNVSIIQEFSKKVKDGKFIKLEFRDDQVTVENYTRKDIMAIYISKGKKPVKKDVTVPDFSGKFREDVDTWAKKNNIKIKYEKEGSGSVQANGVISQSVKAGKSLAKGGKMTVTLSKGKGITVPDFNTIPMQDVSTVVPDLTVTTLTQYSGKVAYGGVISQSIAAGTKLYGSGTSVKVIYSEGRPFIDDMIGRSEKELPAYFYDFTSKGAEINYSVAYVDSSEPKGTVVASSKNAEFVDMNLTVYIQISKGNLKPKDETAPDIGG